MSGQEETSSGEAKNNRADSLGLKYFYIRRPGSQSCLVRAIGYA